MKKFFGLLVVATIIAGCAKVAVLPDAKDLRSTETTCLDTTNNASDCK